MRSTRSQPPRRRWFQFSIKQLLIAVAVCGVGFAALAWHADRARRQRRAVALIEAASGAAYYEFERGRLFREASDWPKRIPEHLEQILGIDFFYDVAVVALSRGSISEPAVIDPRRKQAIVALSDLPGMNGLTVASPFIDTEDVATIGRLHQLERLHFRAIILGPDGQPIDLDLIHLKDLTQLQELVLFEAGVSDARLVNLKGMSQLKSLTLNGNPITDAGLVHLHGLKQLKDLTLIDTQVTTAGVAALKKALPNTEIFH